MKQLIIIGGGNMGFAIADGIVRKGLFPKNKILFFEKNLKRINFLKKKKYFASNNVISTLSENKKNIEAVILAVKPNNLKEVADILKDAIPKNALIISILAGVKIKSIESYFDDKRPVVRVMPNTPCQIGKGISALTYNKNVNKERKELVKNIFGSIGKIVEVKENELDIVTALSGSGPAYFCYFIESLVASGEKLGLSQKLSYDLAFQTAVGTLFLLDKQNIKPEELRQNVTSPKGTTEAALKTFKEKKFDKMVFCGIKAARDRSVELGKLNK